MIGESLDRITEPTLRPIRNAVPKLGGVDISPFILFLITSGTSLRFISCLTSISRRGRRGGDGRAGSRRTGSRRMSTSELTAAIRSATRGRYWPFVTTTVRASSTGSQTRPVVSWEAFGGPPYDNPRATAAGLAAQLLKWHFVLAEPTPTGYQSHHYCVALSPPFSATKMRLLYASEPL
jgi:hypothetical protein